MWTQAFGYDGFGNMTSKTLNGGMNSAPAIDPTTNRLTSGYDANGNMLTGFGLTITYDERNRMASASQMGGTEYYGYAPDNKRIYRWNATTGAEEFTFYGAQGERLGTFTWATTGSPPLGLVPTETNIWFGKKLINRWVVYGGGGPQVVMRDRQGTDRETGASYYPYGDEISSTANDAEKYATYVRDSFTTLDYADQRYYASSYGRFNTADPYAKSARLRNPGSWNRYSYTLGDPVNHNDRRGLCVTDSQGEYWDNGDDVAYDWGVGDCEENPEWLSTANGAALGTVWLNGGLYQPGDSMSVSDTSNPVPCASASGASVDCGEGSGDVLLQIAQQVDANNPQGFINAFTSTSAAAGLVGGVVLSGAFATTLASLTQNGALIGSSLLSGAAARRHVNPWAGNILSTVTTFKR